MDPDLFREWRRWAAAEREGRDDEADSAFRTVFRAVPASAPNPELGLRVSEGVARAAARQARLTRLAVAAGGILAAVLALALILQIPRLLQGALTLSINAVVWTTVAVDRGLGIWAILAQIGRTVAAVIGAPQVTFGLMAIGLIAVAALYGLHRILELEERSTL